MLGAERLALVPADHGSVTITNHSSLTAKPTVSRWSVIVNKAVESQRKR